MSHLKLEHIPNPTGKGAPSFMVSALAFHPPTRRVAGATADFGCFFDAESGTQGATWKETSGADHALFRSDGQLVIVGATLAQVTPAGKRSALSKSLFPGVDPVFSATSVGDFAVIRVIAGEKGRPVMRGVDLKTGEARWTQKMFVDGLTTYAGQVYGVEASRVVRIDLEKGTLTQVADAQSALACLHVDEDGLWAGEQNAPVVHHFDHQGMPIAQRRIQALHALRHITRVKSELIVSGVTLHDVVDGFKQETPFAISDLVSVDLKLQQAMPLGYDEVCTQLGWKHVRIQAVLSTGDALWVGTGRGLLRAR